MMSFDWGPHFIVIASFTANITTSLAINDLKGKVHGLNDLYNVCSGAVF